MPYLSRAEWEKVAEAFLGSRSVEVIDFALKPLNSMGGFMGDHQLATVRVRDASTSHLELQFFVKAFPKALDSQMKIIQQTQGYAKEVEVLSSLFPKIRSAAASEGQRIRAEAEEEWTCKCLLTRPDVIVLEDLVSQGYRTPHPRGPITFKHIQEALTAVAKLHAASLAFEESQQQPSYRLGDVYPELLRESFYRHADNHPGSQFQKAAMALLLALVSRLRGADAARALEEDLWKAMDAAFDLQKPSRRFRNVLCHGDMKRENVLFKYDDGDEGPTDARLVDFQMLRYAPPANDVVSLLYLSTDRAFRRAHFAEALRHYHTRLAHSLRQRGFHDVHRLLPWQTLTASCEWYRMLGVAMATYYAPFSFFRAEHIAHVFASSDRFEQFFLRDRVPEAMHAFDADPFFRRVVTEIVEELLECVVEEKLHLRDYK